MKGTRTQHVPPVKEFKGTKEFQEVAQFFIKNKCYTNLIKGTGEYREFWLRENDRCLYGMTNSYGISITGVHYFYLNYVHIKSEDKLTKRKIYQFPRFLGIDYDYFWLIDACRRQDKDLILVKPRRTGFTLKSATLIAHEYNFYRSSVSVVGAYLDRLSTTTMNAVLDNLNFLNLHTEWKKTRNPDTKDLVKARFQENMEGTLVWKGYMSEVRKVTFKDNPFAGVGLTTSIFLFEEAGTHDNLVESFGLTKPCWADGDNKIGIGIVQGTGGDMTSRTRDFHEMFYNPKQYGFLEFNNIWDDKIEGLCGWFIPATRGKLGEFKDQFNRLPHRKGHSMVDEDGNDDEELARESILDSREVAKSGSNPQILQDAITQYPLTPQEAFLRSKGAMFASPEMLEHLANVETTKSIQDSIEVGDLVFKENNTIEFHPNVNRNYITSFPLKKDEDNRGAVAIFERPEKVNGEIPYGLYIAAADPIDHDKSEVGSLGSFFVYKRFYKAGSSHDILVAEYTGRPEFADEFYENCRKLCIYYNAKVLYENQLKGMKTHFEQKNSLHYMWEQPQIIKDIVKDSKVARGYGIHMNRGTNGSSGIKDQCEIYLRDWLYTEREDVNGRKILNLHTIKSIALLKELIAYDQEGNFDRTIAVMLCILQTKELHRIHVDNMKNSSTNFSQDNFLKKLWIRKEGKSNHNFNFNKLN